MDATLSVREPGKPMLLHKLKSSGCNNNIYSIIHSYFVNGSTDLRLDDHAVSKVLTQGCPQGCVLGPYLWNIGFDYFFDLPWPKFCTLTGYAVFCSFMRIQDYP
jgi:hypothetical protein